MDTSLAYLRESLSNYTEKKEVYRQIYEKLTTNQYEHEKDFVQDLGEEEIEQLHSILRNEIEYAQEEQDPIRANRLNEVYELLI